MRNVEFAKEHGVFIKNGIYENIELYNYQKELLNELEDSKYISVLASRRMGISTTLLIHITNWLINNKSDRKIIYFMSGNSKQNTHFMNSLRRLLQLSLPKDSKKPPINNKTIIELDNGNTVKSIQNIRGVDIITKEKEEQEIRGGEKHKIGKLPYALIVDNAAFNKELDINYKFFISHTNIEQIILCSSFVKSYNFFYDKIHCGNNLFKKLEYKWNLNPNFTNEWYEKFKEQFPEHMYEIDLERKVIETSNLEECKTITKSFRFQPYTIDRISKRLIELNLSLSDYVRDLISKDLDNDSSIIIDIEDKK